MGRTAYEHAEHSYLLSVLIDRSIRRDPPGYNRWTKRPKRGTEGQYICYSNKAQRARSGVH